MSRKRFKTQAQCPIAPQSLSPDNGQIGTAGMNADYRGYHADYGGYHADYGGYLGDYGGYLGGYRGGIAG